MPNRVHQVFRGRGLRPVVSSAVSALLLVILLVQVDLSRIEIAAFHLHYIAAAVFVTLATYLFIALAFSQTVVGRWDHWRRFFGIVALYNFISSVVPFGLGHFSYPYYIRRAFAIPVDTGVASLAVYNVVRSLLLFLLMCGALASTEQFQAMLGNHAVTAAILAVIATAAAVIAGRSRRMSQWISRWLPEKLRGFARAVRHSFEPGRLVRVLLASVAVVALNVVLVYAIYAAIGYQFALSTIILLFTLQNLSNLLPIHGLGRLGSFEAINVGILVLAGYGENESIQISFAYHFLQLAIQGGLAAASYPFVARVIGARLDAEHGQERPVGKH